MRPLPAIRVAVPVDAPRVCAFLRDNFFAAYGTCSTPENIRRHMDSAFSVAKIAAQIAAAEYLTLLAESEAGVIVAVSQLAFAQPVPASVATPAVEVHRFYVAPEWHGRGLADALMAQTVARATGRGRSLWLSAWEEAPRALGFYRRAGFAAVGTTAFVIGDDAKVDMVMCRDLP